MAIQWLEEIRQAEAKADKIRQDAAAQGREIIKSVEEATLESERHAAAEIRAEYQSRMAAKRMEIEQKLSAQSGSKQKALDALRADAEKRIPEAARLAAESIVTHGDR